MEGIYRKEGGAKKLLAKGKDIFQSRSLSLRRQGTVLCRLSCKCWSGNSRLIGLKFYWERLKLQLGKVLSFGGT